MPSSTAQRTTASAISAAAGTTHILEHLTFELSADEKQRHEHHARHPDVNRELARLVRARKRKLMDALQGKRDERQAEERKARADGQQDRTRTVVGKDRLTVLERNYRQPHRIRCTAVEGRSCP
jgi:hypothetical protein